MAFCANVYSERQTDPSNGPQTFIHFRDDIRLAPRYVERPAPQPKVVERAGPDHLHAVYQALLDLLPLHVRHHDDLLRRGLPLEEIVRGGYKSVYGEGERRELARALAPMNLRGVPGFYRHKGEWMLVRSLPGFFIPYRSARGLISGMMSRMDVMIDKQKFKWLSSSPEYCTDGTSSGAPLHFARPELFESAREIWLTEGSLKGHIASYYLDVPFVCAGGVTQWGRKFGETFKARFPNKRIIIAYDRDWRTNRDVRAALERLMRQLDEHHVPYVVRTWEGFKGIDDLVVGLAREQEALAA